MQMRHSTVEYNLAEAAMLLGISTATLKQAVDTGHLKCYYKLDRNNYRFHEASLCANKELLAQPDYLADIPITYSHTETTRGLDVPEVDRPSTPSDE